MLTPKVLLRFEIAASAASRLDMSPTGSGGGLIASAAERAAFKATEAPGAAMLIPSAEAAALSLAAADALALALSEALAAADAEAAALADAPSCNPKPGAPRFMPVNDWRLDSDEVRLRSSARASVAGAMNASRTEVSDGRLPAAEVAIKLIFATAEALSAPSPSVPEIIARASMLASTEAERLRLALADALAEALADAWALAAKLIAMAPLAAVLRGPSASASMSANKATGRFFSPAAIERSWAMQQQLKSQSLPYQKMRTTRTTTKVTARPTLASTLAKAIS